MLALLFCGEFLLHIPRWLLFFFFFLTWGVSLTHPMLASFFLTWGVSLIHPVLASLLSGEFLLHIPCRLYFSVGSFSYTSHAGFYFNLGSFSYTSRVGFIFIWRVSLTHPMLVLVFCGKFRLEMLCHPFFFLFFSFFFLFFLFFKDIHSHIHSHPPMHTPKTKSKTHNSPNMTPSFSCPLPVQCGGGRLSTSLAPAPQDFSTSEAFSPRTVLTENICTCVQHILQHFPTTMAFLTGSTITFSCLASAAHQADSW